MFKEISNNEQVRYLLVYFTNKMTLFKIKNVKEVKILIFR